MNYLNNLGNVIYVDGLLNHIVISFKKISPTLFEWKLCPQLPLFFWGKKVQITGIVKLLLKLKRNGFISVRLNIRIIVLS